MVDIPLQFPDIGNALMKGAHARYYRQEADLKAAEEDRRQQAQPYIQGAMSGDPNAMAQVASGDPKTAMVLATALARSDASQRAKIKDTADWSVRSANSVLQADPKDQPAMYQRMLDEGRALNHDVSKLPQAWDTSVPGILRYHRGVGIDINKQMEEKGRNDRHNNPTSVGGGPAGVEPLPAGPVAPPVAAPASGVSRRVSELPPGVATPPYLPPTQAADIAPQQPPVQTAQVMPGTAQGSVTADYQPTGQSPGPLRPEGITPGSPPVGGPQQSEATTLPLPTSPNVVHFDPTERGGQMRFFVANPQKGLPRRPAIHEGGYVQYTLPNGVDVFYQPKEKPAKPTGPEGTFAGTAIEAQYANILEAGAKNPELRSTFPYAQAYAHFAAPRTTVNENGQMVTVQPNVQHIPKPTFTADGQEPAPGAQPGGQNVTVTPGRGHPIPGSENEKISAGVTLISNLDKALGEYSGAPDAKPSDRTAGFISRNFGQLGDQAAQIMDPGGVRARALISDVTSQIMLARSGAAVTEGEAKRLIGMIPSPADKPQTIIEKLGQIRSTYAEMLRNQTAQYTPKNGFIPHEGAERVLGGPSAPGGSDLKKKYGLE